MYRWEGWALRRYSISLTFGINLKHLNFLIIFLDYGGTDDYEYTMATDVILQTYGIPSNTISSASLVNLIPASPVIPSLSLASPLLTPLPSPHLSPRHRSDSVTSLSSNADYFDALEFQLPSSLPQTPFYTPYQTPLPSPHLVPYTLPSNGINSTISTSISPITIVGLTFRRLFQSSRSVVTKMMSTVEVVPAVEIFPSTATRLPTLNVPHQMNMIITPPQSTSLHRHRYQHSSPQSSVSLPTFLTTLLRAEHWMKRTLGRYLRASTRFHGLLYWVLVYLVVRGGLLDELLRIVVGAVVRLDVMGVRRGLLMGVGMGNGNM